MGFFLTNLGGKKRKHKLLNKQLPANELQVIDKQEAITGSFYRETAWYYI